MIDTIDKPDVVSDSLDSLVRCENCSNYFTARPTKKFWFMTFYGWGICTKENETPPRDVNAEWCCAKYTPNAKITRQ